MQTSAPSKQGYTLEPMQWSAVILTFMIAMSGLFSMDVYLPSLPDVVSQLGTNRTMAQFTMTFFLVSYGLSQLIYGPLSDRFGRRPILLSGFFIYIIGSIACIIAGSINTLLLARLIQGAGAGSATIYRALLRDQFSNYRLAQAASYVAMGISLTPTLAPVLGGFVQQLFGYRGNFVVMLIYSLSLFIIIWWFQRETNQNLQESPLRVVAIFQSYLNLSKNKLLLSGVFCSGLAVSCMVAFAAINPFLMQTVLGVSPAFYGLLTLIIVSGFAIGAIINGRLVSHFGVERMMIIGVILTLIAGVVMFGIGLMGILNLSVIVMPSMVVTLGTSFILPNSMTRVFTHMTTSVGTSGALFGALMMFIATLASILIANTHTEDQTGLALILIGLSLANLLVMAVSFRRG